MRRESERTLALVGDAMGLTQYQRKSIANLSYQEPASVLKGLAFM